jgi:hypothetical protein
MDPVRRPSIPAASFRAAAALEGLRRLAYNLHWAWHPRTRNLWSLIDRTAWTRYRNPIPVISGPTEWSRLLDDEKFLAEYHDALASFDQYMANGSTTGSSGATDAARRPDRLLLRRVRHPRVAGDLLGWSGGPRRRPHEVGQRHGTAVHRPSGCSTARATSASRSTRTGHQEHNYPDYDLNRLPLSRVQDRNGLPLTVTVELPGRDLTVAVWLAQVGRVPVLLLDTDVAENAVEDRPITHILYVRGREMRLHQELVLGIGGVRAIRELGLAPRGLAPQRRPLRVPPRRAAPRACRRGARTRRRLAAGPRTASSRSTPRSPATSASTPTSSAPRRPLLDARGVPVERVLELGLGVDGTPASST